MKRYNRLIMLFISLFIACSAPKDISLIEIITVIDLVDSELTPYPIIVKNLRKFDIRNDWEFYGEYYATITSDSLHTYISGLGKDNVQGISIFSWDGAWIHTIEDKAVVKKINNSPAFSLGASDDKIIAVYLDRLVLINKEGDGSTTITRNFESNISTRMFSATEVHSLPGHFILVWPAFFLKSSRNVLSLTDDSLNCVWELTITGEESPFILEKTLPHGASVPLITLDSLPSNGGFNIACTDSSIFVNPAWLDLFLELDIDGNLLTMRQGTHTFNCSRNISLPGARSSLDITIRELVSQIQYLDNGLLAIMYGPGAFASDSSELWCVDLNTGKYGIFPFSKSVTSFSATNNNVVVSSCIFSQDSTTDRWRAIDGEISTASWDLTPIISQHE